MKLRQKLAVVLASAMVVTAVPVVTMATSTARVSKTVTVAEDTVLGSTTAPELKISLEDAITTTTQFYINLENASFTKFDSDGDGKEDTYNNLGASVVGGTVTVTPSNDTEAVVVVTPAGTVAAKSEININLGTVKVTGEAKVSVDSNNTVVSGSTGLLFANKDGSKASVTAVNPVAFYTTLRSGNEVADIVIAESVSNTLKLDGVTADQRTIVIEIDNNDLEIIDGQLVTIEGSKGFTNKLIDPATGLPCNSVKVAVNRVTDKDELEIILPEVKNPSGYGTLTIKGLRVVSEKNPDEGDVEIYVEPKDVAYPAKPLAIDAVVLKVGEIVEYATKISVAEVAEVKSGKRATFKMTYEEMSADTLPKSEVDFVLEKGFPTKIAGVVVATGNENATRDQLIADGAKISAFYYVYNEWGTIIGFTLKCVPDVTEPTVFVKDVEIEMQTALDMEGEIDITSSGRFVEEQSVVAVNAVPNVKIEGEPIVLKVGQSQQVGGKLVISEVEKGALERNSVLVLSLADDEGITFTSTPKVTVDGETEVEAALMIVETYEDRAVYDNAGNVIGKIEVKIGERQEIHIDLEKSSRVNPSTITVEDFQVTVDRTVPQGAYDFALSFKDADPYFGALRLGSFFVIGTPNEEELAANGLPKGTAEFTIGSSEYTVNGITKLMDGAAYLEPAGYTMVPVRYVAEALGVDVRDILFSNGKVTIFAGSRTIQLTIGSKVAMVNGAPVDMAEAVTSKNDRTYAPMGEIARILGVETEWDSATQTASFINK